MSEEEKNLFSQVLKFLSFRPRSQKEVTDYLSRKTQDQLLIQKITQRLLDSKLVDDSEFTRWLVESRSRSRPRGKRLLTQELKSKGIDLSTIDHELSVMDNSEPELAFQAVKKKLSLWSHLSQKDARQKIIRFLQSRGFSWAAIETVLKKEYN